MITIDRYNFDGPHTIPDMLKDIAGIYAILDLFDNQYSVIDIGESTMVRTRIETHDRKNCWIINSRGHLQYAVLYTPGMNENKRREIESYLRSIYQPSCGVY